MAPLINKEIDSLLGGVSQQPPENRLDSQVEESLNALLDTASGAMKRPPLLHLGEINSTTMRETATHIIDRDDSERYIVNVERGDPSLLSGTTLSVIEKDTQTPLDVVFVDEDDEEETSTPLSIIAWYGGLSNYDAVAGTTTPLDYRIVLNGVLDLSAYSLPLDIEFSGVGVTRHNGNLGAIINNTPLQITHIRTVNSSTSDWGAGNGVPVIPPHGYIPITTCSEITINIGASEALTANPSSSPNYLQRPEYLPMPGATGANANAYLSKIDGSSTLTDTYPNLHITPAANYLSEVGTPHKSVRMLTIADTTFVVNRLKKVAMDESIYAPQTLDQALISCSGPVLDSKQENWSDCSLSGYDADTPKGLEGARWKIPIYAVNRTAGTPSQWQSGESGSGAGASPSALEVAAPATLSTSEAASLQMRRIFGALQISYNVSVSLFQGTTGPEHTAGGTITDDLTYLTDQHMNNEHGGGLIYTEHIVPAWFRGACGWVWDYHPADEAAKFASYNNEPTPTWIVGTYYPTPTSPQSHYAPYTALAKVDVTHPTRERLEFTKGKGENLVIIQNWRGPTDVSKLPAEAPDGFLTKIVGDGEVEADEYYLKYSENDNAWIESIAAETTERGTLYNNFDLTTMPHALKRRVAPSSGIHHGTSRTEGDVYFTFGPEKWEPRKVGDEVMAPEPSFVGQTLNDIVLYKDRLTLLSRDSAMFSEVREPLNFWPTSIMAFVDSDPIDVQAATTTDGVSDFHSGVATEAGLLLFTDSGQFLARSGFQDSFTARTVHVDQISRYQSENISKPAFIGSRVYWVTEQGLNSKVWEYIVTSSSGGGGFSGSATELTGHIPRYLPRNIYKITGNDNESMVCFLSSDEPRNVYVYQYLFNGNNRIQSAWGKWTFDGDIVNGGFIDRSLHLLMDRGDKTGAATGDSTTLEYMPPRFSDPDVASSPVEGMPVCLDGRRLITSQGYNNTSNLPNHQYTEIHFPVTECLPRNPDLYSYFDPNLQIVVGDDGGVDVGKTFTNLGTQLVQTSFDYILYIPDPNGIYQNRPMYVGRKYDQDITLSRFVIKTTDKTRTVKPYTSGRTQIRTFTIRYDQAGPFTITVNNGGQIYTHNFFDPWVLNDALGPKLSLNDEFKIDVGGRNIETSIRIVNDSAFMTNFIGARYEASWNSRSKRI